MQYFKNNSLIVAVFATFVAVSFAVTGVAYADPAGDWEFDSWGNDADTFDFEYSGDDYAVDTTDYSFDGLGDDGSYDFDYSAPSYETYDYVEDYTPSYNYDIDLDYTAPVYNASDYNISSYYAPDYSVDYDYNYSPSYSIDFSPSFTDNSYTYNEAPVYNMPMYVPTYAPTYTEPAPTIVTYDTPEPVVIERPVPVPVEKPTLQPIRIVNNNVNNNTNTNVVNAGGTGNGTGTGNINVNVNTPANGVVSMAPAYVPADVVDLGGNADGITIANNNVSNNTNTNVVNAAPAPTYVAPVVTETPMTCTINATQSTGVNKPVTLSWSTSGGDMVDVYCDGGVLGHNVYGTSGSKTINPWKTTRCYATVKKIRTAESKTCSVAVSVPAPKILPVVHASPAPQAPTVSLDTTVHKTYAYKTITLDEAPYTGFDDVVMVFVYLAMIMTAVYGVYAYRAGVLRIA